MKRRTSPPGVVLGSELAPQRRTNDLQSQSPGPACLGPLSSRAAVRARRTYGRGSENHANMSGRISSTWMITSAGMPRRLRAAMMASALGAS